MIIPVLSHLWASMQSRFHQLSLLGQAQGEDRLYALLRNGETRKVKRVPSSRVGEWILCGRDRLSEEIRVSAEQIVKVGGSYQFS